MRVLDGQIQRGSGETIRAVIWLCDLRGFINLSEALPRDALIELLNGYFGPMCDAVAAEGRRNAEIHRRCYMLAIFLVGENPTTVCARALKAAEGAQAALAEENQRRDAAGAPRIEYGLPLHIGDVMNGNIGSDSRLHGDWTCRQPHRAHRIDVPARQLLLSSDFVRAATFPPSRSAITRSRASAPIGDIHADQPRIAGLIKRDPDTQVQVFQKDHAQIRSRERDGVSSPTIALSCAPLGLSSGA